MADDPKKVAPRTLFHAEKVKAERRYMRLAQKVKALVEGIVKNSTGVGELKDKLRALTNNPTFKQFCEEEVSQIVTMLATGQKKSWRAAASASSKGRNIFKALMDELKEIPIQSEVNRIIKQNSKLISTVPADVAEKLSKLAMKRQFQGIRPEEITKEILEKAPHLTEAQAKRIARTEAGKAATALIQARAKNLGLEFYIWKTCKDERVRDSHKLMQGVVCRWDDPPDPETLAGEKSAGAYHPHGIYNCRCEAAIVVDEYDLKFPVRVHRLGSIITVNNLRDFKAMFGIAGEDDSKLYDKNERKKRRLFGFGKK